MSAIAKGSDSGRVVPAGKKLPVFESAKIEGGALQLAATTEDHDALMSVFGTCSPEFAAYAVGQLMNLLTAVGAQDVTIALRQAVAAIGGIAPSNEAEAMLAVQMVCTHHAAVEMTRKAIRADNLEVRSAHGNLSTKFNRTYLAQMAGLAKIRRGGEQVVKHVHVNEGGQAVIAGTFNHGKRDGG